jgi:2-oxo-4-hydroxy-4-carboxy--5-ureidoimidazoline (OHCU) decarboxylase
MLWGVLSCNELKVNVTNLLSESTMSFASIMRGAAILALTVVAAEMQRHAALLRQYPELAGVT